MQRIESMIIKWGLKEEALALLQANPILFWEPLNLEDYNTSQRKNLWIGRIQLSVWDSMVNWLVFNSFCVTTEWAISLPVSVPEMTGKSGMNIGFQMAELSQKSKWWYWLMTDNSTAWSFMIETTLSYWGLSVSKVRTIAHRKTKHLSLLSVVHPCGSRVKHKVQSLSLLYPLKSHLKVV